MRFFYTPEKFLQAVITNHVVLGSDILPNNGNGLLSKEIIISEADDYAQRTLIMPSELLIIVHIYVLTMRRVTLE